MIYHVKKSPVYDGPWWLRGKRVWNEFAADPDDEDFYIPQAGLMALLAKAQMLAGWETSSGTPFLWTESVQSRRLLRRKSRKRDGQ